jgi:hypothetical protein
MLTRHFALALLAATFAFASTAAPAQTRDGIGIKRHAKKPAVRAPYIGTKIACSKGGCRSVPANCKVTMEETWEGPTGYEIVACP